MRKDEGLGGKRSVCEERGGNERKEGGLRGKTLDLEAGFKFLTNGTNPQKGVGRLRKVNVITKNY